MVIMSSLSITSSLRRCMSSVVPSRRVNVPVVDRFVNRHVGPRTHEINDMCKTVGVEDVNALTKQAVPESIQLHKKLNIEEALTESELKSRMASILKENKLWRSYIGMGYYGTFTPEVVAKCVLGNPGWYTQYTPYQPEISQGRLESLLNYQTMICDMTGMTMANSSLLDEATACAEALSLAFGAGNRKKQNRFFVDERCHPQNIEVVRTRAAPFGVAIDVGDFRSLDLSEGNYCGVLVQYPNTEGTIDDFEELGKATRAAKALFICATDLMALALLKPPGEFGADIVLGNSQRFGVPLGYGGPHAAFFAVNKSFARKMPGRIVGISKDALGNEAYRLALQAREQHIRRERATSNICTAQALLANMASHYAIYHGPEGIKKRALYIHNVAKVFANAVSSAGVYNVESKQFFDTIVISTTDNGLADKIRTEAERRAINLRQYQCGHRFGVSIDETVCGDDLMDLLDIFGVPPIDFIDVEQEASAITSIGIPGTLFRSSSYLSHKVFNSHHSETRMMRYLKHLENRDLSLVHTMTPLGSCTMKLNAAVELLHLQYPQAMNIHPFAPRSQVTGYQRIFDELEQDLCELTGYDAVSLQPNSGANGEYAGLRCITAYLADIGQSQRNICLIPVSAHGTNPASAHMAGFEIVTIQTDVHGNIDIGDLRSKAKKHKDELACLMLTYPSTYGVFEQEVTNICDIIHEYGGQIYMDGANMNAQVGLCRPGDFGSDVSHLNLHKTFCIPHGGGGPGMGPIGVRAHLAPYLPKSTVVPNTGGAKAFGEVSAHPFGSPAILPISWAYIRLMGADGLKEATQIAILNSNYMARRLQPYYPIMFREVGEFNAHEFILDTRQFKESANIEATDIAKRLQDYGFHAPTMSWPVANTLMIEPTESEDKEELDRYCDALICIRNEIKKVESGEFDALDNPLKNAPHTQSMVVADEWTHQYSRDMAAFPVEWLRSQKFWPTIGRVDDVFGDRNLLCTRE